MAQQRQQQYIQQNAFSERQLRKPVHRRTVDPSATLIHYLQERTCLDDDELAARQHGIQPTAAAIRDLLPTPVLTNLAPGNAFCTKFVHQSTNKIRSFVNVVVWAPDARRLLTGAHTGEFTLWNGVSFNFETILQSHDNPIRSMVYSHDERFLVSADQNGSIKYWQPNMNNIKVIEEAHKESVRGIAFAPTDVKFVSCSDDREIKIWDFLRGEAERTLTGHGWDVKSVDWHPTEGLIASGSKENTVKLWDPRADRALTTLLLHKNTVTCVKFSPNGQWLLTAGRDGQVKLYDLRKGAESVSFKGHEKEVCSLAWHPFQHNMFCSGGSHGDIHYWLTDNDVPQASIPQAHDNQIWTMNWHPLGHVLTTGSNDTTAKFWIRHRPGDTLQDKYNLWRGGSAENVGASSGAVFTPLGFGGSTSGGAIPGLSGPEAELSSAAAGGPGGGMGGGGGYIPGLSGGIPGLQSSTAPLAPQLQQSSTAPLQASNFQAHPTINAGHATMMNPERLRRMQGR